MATNKCTTKNGLSDLQLLILELEKQSPDAKAIKNIERVIWQ